MTPAQILSRAADILEARGWKSCTLAYEAIAQAAGPKQSVEHRAALALAHERIGSGDVIAWSGHFDRTLPQVLAMLRGQDWRSA